MAYTFEGIYIFFFKEKYFYILDAIKQNTLIKLFYPTIEMGSCGGGSIFIIVY